ncbi:hypothetical protein AGMMS49921_10040 [Endomicrobiia bacterium]|nr:hypothetical protein AGMMS49921_10040 [Endomicrobiia bacterium]
MTARHIANMQSMTLTNVSHSTTPLSFQKLGYQHLQTTNRSHYVFVKFGTTFFANKIHVYIGILPGDYENVDVEVGDAYFIQSGHNEWTAEGSFCFK